MLPTLIEQVPDIFVPTVYASEFDGKLSNPVDRQAFVGKTMKRNDLSVMEMTMIVNQMNKDGTLPQEEQTDDILNTLLNLPGVQNE